MNCNYCERKCDINNEEVGYCGMYRVHNGQIVEKYPDTWSSYYASLIEQIPFFHVQPNSRSMVIGSFGCNMNCHYCMNAYVAKGNPEEIYSFKMTPENMIRKTKQSGCNNIVFGVNEVTVSLPSAIRLAKAARAEGIPVGCLTNAYMTEEATELMIENMNFFNISLKSMSSAFYNKYTEIDDVAPILRNINNIGRKRHIEITTPIVQTENDSEIMDIAKFISDINPNIPWHIFRLIPEYKMKNNDYPDIEEISKLLANAKKLLPNLYFSNFVGSEWVTTNCPDCGAKLIDRVSTGACGGMLIDCTLKDGCCPNCKVKVHVLGKYVSWDCGEGKI